jgi:regulator of PEP synthase PpsR (kinase-PPPase family)
MGSGKFLKTKEGTERIAILSDGTCDTAETYVRAILSQFNLTGAHLHRFPGIRDEVALTKALDQLSPPFLVAYTFATELLRKKIWTEAKKRNLLGVDILYPAIDAFSDFLNSNPSQEHGVFHSTQAINYFERIEAVEFTVKHDDGMKMNDLDDADLILTGVSRTSKTPTSMYLAHKGYRVANIPLVMGIEPSSALLQAAKKQIPIFFLTIEAAHLARIRRARFDRLGTARNHSDTYVDIQKIQEELDAAKHLARCHHWKIIDVTNKAVEETASEILLLLSSKDS